MMEKTSIGSQTVAEEPLFQALLRWFIVLTKPSREALAQANLERQGFRVYSPHLSRMQRHRGRWVDRIVPLFPRYLFVQLDVVRQSLVPVRSTLGVAGLVRFGEEPKVVPNSIVDSLVARADPETGLHRLNSDWPPSRGARVSVVAGAFNGLDGVFERDAGGERSVVLLGLLGQQPCVTIPSGYLAPTV
jgi:transcriptional antiterminator RfaH